MNKKLMVVLVLLVSLLVCDCALAENGDERVNVPSSVESKTLITDETATPWPQKEYLRMQINVVELPEDERMQSWCGPHHSYHGAGAYKTYKMTRTEALFIENGYIFVDMSYSTVGRRCVYFGGGFTGTNHVPQETFTGYEAATTVDVIPTFGPGSEYDTFEKASITAETELSVFFEENGWVFAEFFSGLGPVRAWIPVEYVQAR